MAKNAKNAKMRVNFGGLILVRTTSPFQIIEKIPKMKGFHKEMDHKWKAFVVI